MNTLLKASNITLISTIPSPFSLSHNLFYAFDHSHQRLVVVLRGIYHINSEAHHLIFPNMHLNGFLIFSNKDFYCESFFLLYFVND